MEITRGQQQKQDIVTNVRNEIGMILIFQRSLTNELERIIRLNYGVYMQTGSCSVAEANAFTSLFNDRIYLFFISHTFIHSHSSNAKQCIAQSAFLYQSIQSDIDDKRVKQGMRTKLFISFGIQISFAGKIQHDGIFIETEHNKMHSLKNYTCYK